MTRSAKKWVDKAEGDWQTALLLYRARKHPNYDNACFHLHQCAEKYLKARLEEAGIDFEKTHNLINLLKLVLPLEPAWKTLRPALKVLNDYAVDVRYPDFSVDKAEAKVALAHCRAVRKTIRQSFGLPV